MLLFRGFQNTPPANTRLHEINREVDGIAKRPPYRFSKFDHFHISANVAREKVARIFREVSGHSYMRLTLPAPPNNLEEKFPPEISCKFGSVFHSFFLYLFVCELLHLFSSESLWGLETLFTKSHSGFTIYSDL